MTKTGEFPVQRAASDVMQSILLSAVIDALEAMKAASKGVPNLMLRDLQSVHRNTTFADLPKSVQDSIAQSVRAAFTQFLKEGYAVGPKQEMQQSRPMDRVPERQRNGARVRDRARPPAGLPRAVRVGNAQTLLARARRVQLGDNSRSERPVRGFPSQLRSQHRLVHGRAPPPAVVSVHDFVP